MIEETTEEMFDPDTISHRLEGKVTKRAGNVDPPWIKLENSTGHSGKDIAEFAINHQAKVEDFACWIEKEGYGKLLHHFSEALIRRVEEIIIAETEPRFVRQNGEYVALVQRAAALCSEAHTHYAKKKHFDAIKTAGYAHTFAVLPKLIENKKHTALEVAITQTEVWKGDILAQSLNGQRLSKKSNQVAVQ